MSKTEITLTLSFRPQGWQLDGIYQSVWKWQIVNHVFMFIWDHDYHAYLYINWWWLMHPFDHNETVKYQR